MARETVSIEGLDKVLDRLKALGQEASVRGGPARKAVRAGAMVILKEARTNIRRIVAEPNKSGADVSSGLMEKSIRPIRAKANRRGLKGETFTLKAPARARYPEGSRANGDAVQKIANILEYGGTHNGVRRQAHPWMRPAFLSKKDEAVRVITSTILKEIDKLEKKLGRT